MMLRDRGQEVQFQQPPLQHPEELEEKPLSHGSRAVLFSLATAAVLIVLGVLAFLLYYFVFSSSSSSSSISSSSSSSIIYSTDSVVPAKTERQWIVNNVTGLSVGQQVTIVGSGVDAGVLLLGTVLGITPPYTVDVQCTSIEGSVSSQAANYWVFVLGAPSSSSSGLHTHTHIPPLRPFFYSAAYFNLCVPLTVGTTPSPPSSSSSSTGRHTHTHHGACPHQYRAYHPPHDPMLAIYRDTLRERAMCRRNTHHRHFLGYALL